MTEAIAAATATPAFENLGLRDEILRAVAEKGYVTPTPIQMKAIPAILAGKDIMGGAQTGTGKTAGFTLPILQLLAHHASPSPSPARHPVRALILTPTRELAIQVAESVAAYGKFSGLRSTVVFGGVNISAQIAIVRGGVEILIATPGRLLDHIEQKTVNLGQVEIFVLDEADRMLDMGFIPDIKRIMALLPKKRQNLLFSATFSEEIKKLADQLLNQPELIEVARRNAAAELVTHSVYRVAQDQKRSLFTHLIRARNADQVLVFMRTKHGASRLARQLEKDGFEATAIHGDKSQSQRIEALDGFKANKVQILVATDVAARGLDITDLPLVVNYELPHVAEDYIHRIGRTGRAGASGEAISLVSPDEEKHLVEIEKLLKRKIELKTADGFVPSASSHETRSPTRGGRSTHAPGAGRDSMPRREPRSEGAREPRREPRAASAQEPRREPQEGARDARRDMHADLANGAGAGEARRPRSAPRPESDRSRDKSHYDLNPDQPLPVPRSPSTPRAPGSMSSPGERTGGRHAAVAALLRKRHTPAQ
ncbi:MAG: DEAD/DEAH box helicase [Betaproteobacteria bacterium]